jgi:hypothetical protein
MSTSVAITNRQTQSKDPALAGSIRGDATNFLVVVRFFDEHAAEVTHLSSREAAACENPARRCRISKGWAASPVGTTQLNPAR